MKELREELAKNIDDPLLANFIENHIAIISKSLAEYNIKGSSALNNRFATGLTEIVENEETIRENQKTSQVKKKSRMLGSFFKKLHRKRRKLIKHLILGKKSLVKVQS